MTYRLIAISKGTEKIVKDAITAKPRVYATSEDALASAESLFALARCNWKNQGRDLPKFRVEKIEVRA